jgi:hypothetical protein
VSDAPPLSRAEQATLGRRLAKQALVGGALRWVSSILVCGQRHDTWRHIEVLRGRRADPALKSVPLVTFAARVQVGEVTFERIHSGPPFPVPGVEALAPERAAEQLAVADALAYDERQAVLQPYRQRASRRPESFARLYELGLMTWYQHFAGAPGPVGEAEPPLLRALQLNPRSAACHGLLGEVRLRGGRARPALAAFLEAARLLPRHPRFHYCASVAHQLAGDVAAARRALARARRMAGPKLKRRFTSGSNPLEDFRYSLLCEATRLRERHEGFVRLSSRELAERDREENRIRRSRVPKHLRALVPLAEKWGIGDDGSRAYLLRRATRRDKLQLRRVRDRYAQRISDWLDSQLPDRPTPETGAFLYLLEACEELL